MDVVVTKKKSVSKLFSSLLRTKIKSKTGRWVDKRKDSQRDRQMDGRTDGQTDRQTNGRTDRITDGRTDNTLSTLNNFSLN